MTPEQIEQWADMCTPRTETGSLNYLKFAKLVEAATREECANVCDERANGENDAQWCADRIRSMK